MMNYFLAFLFIAVLIIGGNLLFNNSIQDQISKKLKEDEKTKKETNDLEQQLRDEDEYDSNYRKHHS